MLSKVHNLLVELKHNPVSLSDIPLIWWDFFTEQQQQQQLQQQLELSQTPLLKEYSN